MIGHRPSSLPIAQYCGMSPRLSAQHGAGRAAAMSTAWHARCAGQPQADDLLARLSPEEQATVKSWPKPTDVVLDGGLLLSYTTAEHELPVGLDAMGQFAAPDSDACLTGGTLDMAWHRDGVAYIADLKKSRYTCVDGPDSLQLHAYGWAYARLTGCHSYTTGLWIAETGEWQWSAQAVTLDNPESDAIIDRIVAAASNTEERYNTGPHCAGCYARTHCPEHTLAAAATETWLAPLTSGDPPTPDVGLELWTKIRCAQDVLDKAEAQLKSYVEHGKLTLTDPTGKTLCKVQCAGRKSLDREALEIAFGKDAIADYEKQGAPFYQWKWLKPKKA